MRSVALESRMVLSVETTLQHPRRSFFNLEDTVAVTETGHEVYGDRAHGWKNALPAKCHGGSDVLLCCPRRIRNVAHL